MTTGKKINKAEIETLIPHQGIMCLIDQVDSWGQETLICRSHSHLNPENPLRMNDQLSSIHLLEYGAQSIAIHGGLLRKAKRPGFLAAIRHAEFFIDRIDNLDAEIIINTKAEVKTDTGAVYEFVITADSQTLLTSRATVINF
jgi:predicted hotdog family 3-hydroxylacyl-ACP dehydratase